MQQKERAVQVFRPALLPDHIRLVWYPLTICGVLATLGYILDNLKILKKRYIPVIVG